MKSLLLFLVITSSSSKVGVRQKADEWTPVSTYLAFHSLNYDPTVDARLHEEATSGKRTWSVAIPSSDWALSDPALGWPSEDCTLRFGSILEVAVASQMIMEVTLSQTPK